MTHREATECDCSLPAEMNHQLIRDERHRNPMSVTELAKRMHDWLSSGACRAILFEHDSVPLADALFRTESDSTIYLRQFFVSRDHRRQGVGPQAADLLLREVFPPAARISRNRLRLGSFSSPPFPDLSTRSQRLESLGPIHIPPRQPGCRFTPKDPEPSCIFPSTPTAPKTPVPAQF